MSDKETICRVAFVNNNPDDKVFQPYPSGDYTAIKTAELTDLKRQLAEAQKDNERAVLQAQDALLQLAEAQSNRDKDWVLAIAAALGMESGIDVPIVPDSEPFKRLFAAIAAAKGGKDE